MMEVCRERNISEVTFHRWPRSLTPYSRERTPRRKTEQFRPGSSRGIYPERKIFRADSAPFTEQPAEKSLGSKCMNGAAR